MCAVVEVSVTRCRSVSVYVLLAVGTAPEEGPIKGQTRQNKLVPRRMCDDCRYQKYTSE